MKGRLLISLVVFLIANTLQAQNVLEQYIQTGLESNIALQRKELSYTKSLAALREAKGLFFPKLSIEARYSVARGGRAIIFPVGDLMNPVYDNLDLLNGFGEAASPDYPTIPDYPSIQNEEINFLRETEHETVVRIAMPVFNAAILNNHRIKQNLTEVEKISVGIYKRELVKEIKTAYFNYAKAEEAYALYQNTVKLVEENLRTSESLHRNNKVTIDQVYTAKAEVEAIEQELAVAEKNVQVSRAYFNFLLNREYNEPIELISKELLPSICDVIGGCSQNGFPN